MLRRIHLSAFSFFRISNPQEQNPDSADISQLRSFFPEYSHWSHEYDNHTPLCSAESLESLLESVEDGISDSDYEDNYIFDEYPVLNPRHRPPTPSYKKFASPLKHSDIYSWYYESDASTEY